MPAKAATPGPLLSGSRKGRRRSRRATCRTRERPTGRPFALFPDFHDPTPHGRERPLPLDTARRPRTASRWTRAVRCWRSGRRWRGARPRGKGLRQPRAPRGVQAGGRGRRAGGDGAPGVCRFPVWRADRVRWPGVSERRASLVVSNRAVPRSYRRPRACRACRWGAALGAGDHFRQRGPSEPRSARRRVVHPTGARPR